MEEVKRVPTTKEKKKSTTLLIILAVLLGIALIATAVYFYTLGETTETETTTEVTCACYVIDPNVISECGDPRRGFLFELSTVPADQTCRANCSTADLSTNLLNSSTEQDQYQICHLQVVQDSRCNEMTIKDSAGKIVTGKIPDEEEISIEAKFDQEYTDYTFTINNQELEPDNISADGVTITKSYSEPTATAINISASATDSSGNKINSPICKRLIQVDQESVSDVSAIQIEKRLDEDVYKVSKIKIGIGNISEEDTLKIRFSFDNSLNDLIMNEGFTIDASKGEITILEQDLYNPENFGSDLNFSQLDGLEGKIGITAEVSTDEETIGTVEGSFDFPAIAEAPEEEVEEQEAEESLFEVSKTSNVSCVERVSPNNIAQFTLTTSNRGTGAEEIASVKDKLPLGFTYVENTSKINGVTVSDDEYVTITEVGDTQEIVWEKEGGWSVDSGQSLTILFQSQADENALTGNNQNEVVVTPVEVPEDPDSLRAEFVIEVAQSCEGPEEPTTEEPEEEEVVEEEEPVVEEEEPTTPDTGIFDSVIGKIIMGILVVVTGWFIYSKPLGQSIVEKLVDSGVYKEAEIASWRIFKPKKYFETQIIRKLGKKKKKD
jgi:uncharacterized repeat protein (TIGR01451 family)